jgi:hypothetical protein
MVAVIRLTADVVVMADCGEAEALTSAVIDEELELAKQRIVARLRDLDVDVSLNPPMG